MKRKIIEISEERCNGCGLCVDACHEGAIALVDGKAKLMRDDYCDGLGNCLPVCPTGAITFVEREAAAFNEEAVKQNQAKKAQDLPCGCPGTNVKTFNRPAPSTDSIPLETVPSELRQWPVQIKLVPANAPYFNNANLLIAADCTAYACGDFNKRFMKNKVTLIGCPKLDSVDYADKLTDILLSNEIKSITVIRMEVPCCGGIVEAVKNAILRSGKLLPWRVITVTTDGNIIED